MSECRAIPSPVDVRTYIAHLRVSRRSLRLSGLRSRRMRCRSLSAPTIAPLGIANAINHFARHMSLQILSSMCKRDGEFRRLTNSRAIPKPFRFTGSRQEAQTAPATEPLAGQKIKKPPRTVLSLPFIFLRHGTNKSPTRAYLDPRRLLMAPRTRLDGGSNTCLTKC